MVHGTGTHDGAAVADRSVELRVAATVENLAVLRALVSAVATFEDLDFDAVSDLRLAVDEAATRLIRSAVDGSALVVRVVQPEDARSAERRVGAEHGRQCRSRWSPYI